MADSLAQVDILRIEDGISETRMDYLAVEEPLEIRLVYGPFSQRIQKNISITMRTPGHDFELATGFLFTEGLIKNESDISKISYLNSILNPENIVILELKENVQLELNKMERNFYTTSSCGVCGKASIDAVKTTTDTHKINKPSDLKIRQDLLCQLPQKLREHQEIFETTGGLHASALFNLNGELLLTREDVGRHNALDKLIGVALTKNLIPFDNYILLLSGRASFELIQKAAMAGIKVVAAIGAPSSLAVQMAKEFDITLIGFLSLKKFNIYCGDAIVLR